MGSVNITPKNKLLISVKVESGARGPQGLIGITPQLTVIDTITGAPNTSANVVLSGTAENPGLTFTIPQGRPFIVEVEYPTIEDLENNTNSNPSPYTPTLFDLAIIVSDQGAEDPDNAKLYIFDNGPIGGWSFVSDLSGATGPRRELRWKPDNGGTTSTLQWRTNDGTNWDEANEKDLGLKFNFSTDNDELKLHVENSDGETDEINLTATAEFGPGGVGQPKITAVKFINNNNTETNFQELGVYGSFDGTELKLLNPNGAEESQELGLSFDWDDTELGVKTPTDEEFTYQKLSPDIDFRNETNGVELSLVEPGVAKDYIKISPDIAFQNEGDGLELSIVEPEAAASFNKVSPDITWDGTQLAITEPNTSPEPGDYVELGLTSEFGAGSTTDTTLTITNPQPESTPISQELGVYASWNNTELILTNPDGALPAQELALDFNWDGTTLQIKNPTESSYASANEQKLSPDIAFSTSNGVSISVVEPGAGQNLIKISPDISFQTGTNGELEFSVVEPLALPIYNQVSPQIVWDGTKLAVIQPGATVQTSDYVDLKGETGDPAVAGTPLFKIRDQEDLADEGLQVAVADEIQFTGGSGVDFIRNDKVYTVSITEIDGGGF